MTQTPSVKIIAQPPVNRAEILRYAGAGADDCGETSGLLDGLIDELLPSLVYRVCYAETTVAVEGGRVSFGFSDIRSFGLADNLRGCGSAVVFAATVGFAPDILARAGRNDPLRGLLIHSIGAERVESLCDEFCKTLGGGLRPRFSPGYGDLPLSFQRDIFDFLSPERLIGLTLNENMTMSPTKSVTAIVGRCFDNDGIS